MPIVNPINPRKKFPYRVEFEGLEPALVQKVKIPKVSQEVAEHGAANILIKTAGMVKIEDIELNKLMFSNKADSWAYSWFLQVSNHETGTMGIPTTYKKNGYIILLGPDMQRAIEKWQVFGCFPKEVEKEEFDSKAGGDNLMEKVVLSVDTIIRIK
jgi:phage tail-like protein